MPPSKRRTPPRNAASGFKPVMPLLPHERDETTTAPAPVQPVMAQAKRDVDRGLIDTDCYSRLGKLIPRRNKV